MLEFAISNQLLSRLDGAEVFSGSRNYLECRFQFSEDWDGLKKVAMFGHSQVEEPIGVELEEDVCQVPWEVIEPYGFQLAVYGTGGEKGSHVPTNVVTVEVGKSGEDEELSPEPSQSLFDRVMAKLSEAEEETAGAKVSAAASAERAQSAADDASESRAIAQSAREAVAGKTALAEQYARDAAERAESILGAVETCQEKNREAREQAALAKGYAEGCHETGEAILKLTEVKLSQGEKTCYGVRLEPWKRYVVLVDGEKFDGVSRLVEETGGLATAGLIDEEEKTETPSGGTMPESPDLELPEENETENGGAIEEPETPEIPSGEDDIIGELPETEGKRVIRLEAGGVEMVYTKILPIVEEEGEEYETLVISGAEDLATLEVRGDGEDNGRFYLERTRAAAEEAKETAEGYVASCKSYATDAKVYQNNAITYAGKANGYRATTETKAKEAAASAEEAQAAKIAAAASAEEAARCVEEVKRILSEAGISGASALKAD